MEVGTAKRERKGVAPPAQPHGTEIEVIAGSVELLAQGAERPTVDREGGGGTQRSPKPDLVETAVWYIDVELKRPAPRGSR